MPRPGGRWPRRRCGRYPDRVRIALIPVKELSQAKARLAPLLDAAERRELARAMYRDVLAAALACQALDTVAVVSRDEEALSTAQEAGAEGLPEPGGLNEALGAATTALAARGAQRILVLAADLPLATPEELALVLEQEADVVIAAAKDGGTNALALAPGAIPFHFGPNSAQRHREAAASAGLRVVRLHSPTLAFDIDTPDDLRELRAAVDDDRAIGGHTKALFRARAAAG